MNLHNKKPLRWALQFSKAVQIIVSILFLLFLIIIIYALVNKEAPILLKDSFVSGFGIGKIEFCENCEGKVGLSINDISNAMLLWLFVRGSSMCILVILIIRKVISIIQSIKSKHTFYSENIKGFRSIARYGVLLSIFSFFNFYIQDDISDFHFSIPFGPIILTLSCWFLADVFQEGKELSDDSSSIV